MNCGSFDESGVEPQGPATILADSIPRTASGGWTASFIRLLREPLAQFLMIGLVLFFAYAFESTASAKPVRPTRSCSRRTIFASCKPRSRRSGSALPRLRRCAASRKTKSARKFCTARRCCSAWIKMTSSLSGVWRRRCNSWPRMLPPPTTPQPRNLRRGTQRTAANSLYRAGSASVISTSRLTDAASSAHDDAIKALAKIKGRAGRVEERSSPRRSVHVPGLLCRSHTRRVGQGIRVAICCGHSESLSHASWQGPVESGYGWHLVFVDSVIPGRIPVFEEVEPDVKTAWLAAQKQQAWQKAYEEMRAKYSIVLPAPGRAGVCEHSIKANRNSSSIRRGPTVTGLTARVLWVSALVALAASVAWGHEARPAYLEIQETAPGQFSVLWRTPVMAGMRLQVVLQLPDNVRNLQEPRVEELSGFNCRTPLD